MTLHTCIDSESHYDIKHSEELSFLEHYHWGKCGIRSCSYGYPKMEGDVSVFYWFYNSRFRNNFAVFFGVSCHI